MGCELLRARSLWSWQGSNRSWGLGSRAEVSGKLQGCEAPAPVLPECSDSVVRVDTQGGTQESGSILPFLYSAEV